MGDEDEVPRAALAAGGVSRSRRFGGRRSPTTGHRIRRPQTPEPGKDIKKEEKQIKRSLSSPGELRRNISSSSDEEGFIKEAKTPPEEKVTEQIVPPKPVLRKRVKSLPKSVEDKINETKPKEEEEEDDKEKGNVNSSSSWWKSWQNWAAQPRGKSLEREPGTEPPQAVPRKRNRSLTRPSQKSNKKRNASLSIERNKSSSQERKSSPSNESPKSQEKKKLTSSERRKQLSKERTSFDDSSDEFWKPGSLESALIRLEREIKEIPQENRPIKTPKKYQKAHDETPQVTLRQEWNAFLEEHADDLKKIKLLRNYCASSFIILMIYCGLGGIMFRFIEGAFESFYKCGVKRVKRDFVDSLWTSSHNLREEEWKSLARRKLMTFEEQLHEAFEAGTTSYSGQRSWSFLNSVIYCLTAVTTIGYGHISPSTTTGRAVTIAYAIIGIPMFLILLADFGKLFTRGIKFIWAFVRRVYYTGSCRKVRRTVPVQEMMKGVQMVYDIATFRRPSQIPPGTEVEGAPPLPPRTAYPQQNHNSGTDPPGTPALSTFAVDDEFNIPITVAIVILLIYIVCGALVFWYWEGWGFFESFYFVFISMSTIGFGDFVPQNQMYMMASIVYLVFGLALTSMCINVVQEKLSDTFRKASAKIGATIGLQVAEEDGAITPAKPIPVELAEVHTSAKKTDQQSTVNDIQEKKSES
ncbi:uncharacterized protein LOC142334445 isoform X1 [Lycorma delicatula]|uniref:uncharacterized protein LOC142334445 isoform X1 n=1 Tax=Lycorma delicatula TaxID=130591 RepID=UPI003F50FA1D